MLAVLLLMALALPAGAVATSTATIEDDCAGDPTQEGWTEVVLEPVDICAGTLTLSTVDGELVAEVVIDVVGGLEAGVPTSHRFGWTGEDGCERYVEVRDEAPTADGSAAIAKVDCEQDLQNVGSTTLSPDACPGVLDRRRDCVGDPGTVVAIPDTAVQRTDSRITVTWDVTATLPSTVEDATVAAFAPGAELADLEVRASLRAGHANQLGPISSGSSCVLGYCHRPQGTTDTLTSTTGIVVPQPEEG